MGKSKSAFTGFRSLQIAMLYTKLIQIENCESSQTTYPRGAWAGFSPRLDYGGGWILIRDLVLL